MKSKNKKEMLEAIANLNEEILKQILEQLWQRQISVEEAHKLICERFNIRE